MQDLARAIGVSKSTVQARLKEKQIRRHSNAIKSYLTPANMKARIEFAISMIESSSIPRQPIFKWMYNIVHIDEKWFYRTNKVLRIYLASDENEPERTTKSKNFIEKVMFLCAQARPRYDDDGNMTWDGKIGIWPFTFQEEAKRDSPNRLKGTLLTKAMTSVTRDVIRIFMINKVIPAIKAKWPLEDMGSPIFIQQDNAKTHIPVDDPQFSQVAQSDGFDIRLMCQRPNSPDCNNVLDLGFFAALQAAFQKEFPDNIDDIVKKVKKAYDDYPPDRANRVFLTLQSCLREILRAKGGQHYKIPHMRKATLERLGELPKTLTCEQDIVQEALDFLAC